MSEQVGTQPELSAAMHRTVACGTQCNQILLEIIAGPAAKPFVMHFKI